MKRVISLLLAFVLVFSCTTAIFADTNDDYDYLAYVREMERFVGIKDGTTLVFDSEAALAAGYDKDTVDNIVMHIECMNLMISEYGGFLSDDYSVTVVIRANRGGVTKIEYLWYGLTKVYLDSYDTQDLLYTLHAIYTGNNVYINAFLNLAENYLGPIYYLWYATTLIYISQIEACAQGGNGIIINLYNDTNYNQTIVYYESQ